MQRRRYLMGDTESMRKVLLVVAAIAFTSSCGDSLREILAPTQPSVTAPANIAGTWTGDVTSQIFAGSPVPIAATLTQTGADVTGTLSCPAGCLTRGVIAGTFRGTMNGTALTAQVTFPENASCPMFNGTLSGSTLTGTYRCTVPPLADQGTWRMTRQ